ncbi:DUF1127 domain-containing protein [Poseidonocella sedimentorum]|uniref:Uncharacterized conserved protein YjiS, DUF1127 family n=1 Tax=Poseidonocella sedimentorum TaxID=871652 RepID=A0A1I6E7L2_9RHOB|nr:DUF1127 domain-containing protein [Poseidonocella sedimentorum]SFR13743.1 Uncharacterized conserved protein YjiS, DUF1127 family [Poseidonocella sedimentorum]
MAFFDSIYAASHRSETPRAIYRIVTAIADWRAERNTRKALSALSDRELDDIGLSRWDIDRVARNGGAH